MSKQQEREPSCLRGSVDRTLREIGQLGQEVVKTVDAGQVGQLQAEVVVTLAWIRELAGVTEEFISRHGGVIYPGDGVKSGETTIEAAVPPVEGRRPTTFGELLRLKIDEVLPSDKENFIPRDLSRAVGYTNNAWLKKTLSHVPGKKFSRQEAVAIIAKTLTTPSGHVTKNDGSTYTQPRLKQSFKVTKEQLDRWSSESSGIGYDWSESPTVKFGEAMAIRALGILERNLNRGRQSQTASSKKD